MVELPVDDSDEDFELARRAVQLGWLTREQVEVALLEVELLPSSRLLTHLPLTPDQIRKLEQAPASLPKEVAAASADPDRRVAQYILGDYQKTGGMGKVVKAWDTRLSRWVALKFLKKLGDERLRAYFEEEARFAAGLAHPNIAAIYEIGEHDGAPFIAMQFIEGRTLDEARRGMKPRESARFVRDAAHAVAFAHESGIIHRDLKPSNIMIDAKGRVFVMDFGLATQTEVTNLRRASGTRTISGTPEYVSPEQARGDEADERTDVYGLGATLYHLVTGRTPNAGKSMAEILRRMEKADRPAPRRLNPRVETDLETIVLKCLELDPSRRYPTAKELAEDLERYLNRDAIAARRQRPLYRLRMNLAKRKMALAAALATVALIATAAIVVPMWRSEARARTGHEVRREQFERARPHLEAGRTILQRMKLLMRGAYTQEALNALGDQARAQFGRALEAAPEHPEAHLGSAMAFSLEWKQEPALEALGRAIRADGEFAPAYLERIRLLIDGYELMRHDSTGPSLPESVESRALRERLESDLAKAERYSKEYPQQNYAKALLAFAHGEYAKAADGLGRYLEIDSEDGRAHEWRGHALYHLERYPEAIQALTRAITCDTRNSLAFDLRGITKRRHGLHDEAIADSNEAVRLQPSHARFYTNRGANKKDKGLVDEAIADFDKAIELDPKDRLAYTHRGIAKNDKGLYDEAIADFDKAIEQNPENMLAYGERGLAKGRKGLHEEAIVDFDKAIKLDPKLATAFANRGLAKKHKGLFDEAIADYSKAIELDPKLANAYNNRGLAKKDKGLLNEAITDFDKAIELDSKHSMAYNNRGLAKKAKGLLDASIEDYSKAIELDPSYVDAYSSRGVAKVAKGLLDEGIADYSKAIDLDPKHARTYYNRGLAMKIKGRLDDAIADQSRAIVLDPKDADAYTNRGIAKSIKGLHDEAISDHTKAIELDPKNANAYGNRGISNVELGLYGEAIGDFNKALELAPVGWRYRGMIQKRLSAASSDQNAQRFIKEREYRRAIEELKAVLEVTPHPSQAIRAAYNIACCHALLGEKSDALPWLEKSVELGYRNLEHLQEDPDLNSLRTDPRYKKLVAKLKGE